MKNSNTISILILGAAILAVAGCSSGTTNTAVTTTTTGATSAYVSNQTPAGGSQPTPQIVGFSATSSSSASTSTVNGPSNDTFIGAATDTSGNLYTIDKSTAGSTSYTVNEYAAATNSTGTTASTVMRSFTSTAINAAPVGLTVDGSGNIYVMLTGGTVLRFAAASTGAVSPAATLTGIASAMAVDQSGNLYVTVPVSLIDNHHAIAVYGSGYTSASAALRTILPATELHITALAVDASGNIYATGKDDSNNVQVAVYAAAATGTSTATRVITGATTTLVSPWQVQVDSAGSIFVGDSNTGSTGGTVILRKFAAAATGNIAPSLTISTALTFAATTAMAIH